MTAIVESLPHARHTIETTRLCLSARVGVAARVTALTVLLLHVLAMSASARADVTVNSAVTGPVSGDGGTFTVTAAGEITGAGNGIEAGSGGSAMTTLDVQGSVNVSGYALNVADGASLSTTTNSGLMTGDRVIQTYGGTTIGSITNSGTMSAGGYGVLLYGQSGTFSNLSGGLVSATSNDAIYLIGPTGFVSNAGSVSAGGFGLFVYNTLTTGTNSGSLQGNYGVYVNSSGSTGLLANTGTITGGAHGVQNSGAITTASNAGLITGVRGLQADPGSSFGTLANSGTVQGSEYGMVLYATSGTVSNTAGGLIEATTNTDGIYHEGTTTSLVNGGRILGVRHGLSNNGPGSLSSITNSGTMSGAGGAGLHLNAATTTTTLTNSGLINGLNGIVQSSGSITTLSNSGSLVGANGDGLSVGANSISALTNSGTISGLGYDGDGIFVSTGSIGSIVNQSGGWIGGNNIALQIDAGGSIGSIDNAGTITGWWGVYSPGTIDTFVNRSGGLVFANGTYNEAFATGQLLTSFTNETGGVIQSLSGDAVSLASVTTAVNAGTIEGGYYGIQSFSGTIGSFSNTGLISGTLRGFNQEYATLGSLTNSGTIQGGGYGMVFLVNSGTVSNLAGGRIAGGTEDGIRVQGSVSTLSNAGTIAGGSAYPDAGVELVSTGTIGTLTNTGSISGFQAVRLGNSSGIGSLVNSGTIRGPSDGIQHDGGTIGSLVNQAGGLIQGDNDVGVDGTGTFGSIDNAGTIQGSYGVSLPGNVGTFINRATGVVSGTGSGYGFYSSGTVGSFTNEAGGLIESTNYEGVYLYGDGVGTFTNAGTIRSLNDGDYAGLYVGDSVTTLTNSGTISGYYGISQDDAIGTLTNASTGLLQGTDAGLYVGSSSEMAVTNYGQITGGNKGVYAYYDLGPLTNKSGAVISGTTVAGILIEDDARTTLPTITNEAGALITSGSGAGVKTDAGSSYTRGTIANAGRIEGATTGVDAARGGFLSIANTGTIAYTGTGTGPAVRVGASGILGDATGANGPALTSTGTGARVAGTIEHRGTVHYGFMIENQNVTVSAGGGTGTFTNGTLDVADGNLLFTSGVLALDADIAVDGGAGLFTTEATVALGDRQTITGNFAQSSIGTFRSVITGSSAYGNLDIAGTASFAGGLDLDLSAFTLANGQTFDLFLFDSYTGDFSGLSVDGVALASAGDNQWTYGELTLQEVWTPTSMSISAITAVPEPSTFALGAAGIACAAWLRHRRRKRV